MQAILRETARELGNDASLASVKLRANQHATRRSADFKLERVKGIEPSSQAWEAHILPLNHTRRKSVPRINQNICFAYYGVRPHSNMLREVRCGSINRKRQSVRVSRVEGNIVDIGVAEGITKLSLIHI